MAIISSDAVLGS